MEVLENKIEYLNDFIHLNEEWIKRYFEIETVDKKLAANPQKVIDDGGFIFSLLIEEHVVGVCALFNNGNGCYELARMAVSPQYQGKGYGTILIQACFVKLKKINANSVHLISNTKLKSAISLYKKHGFKVVSEGPHPVYSRANIVMQCNLEG